ncbi:MAG: KTSC domain-containing protein [Deltaproteobacteria bacterium]|nr:KTSC domain-containing protein [Deltaproteobacteria bacterium]
MDWIPVDSSNLARIRYDENTMTLEIEFKGGRVYQYFDVPAQVFEELRSVDSHGKFFNEHIKGHYRYARV